ncbi:hypothetical protein BDQ17DRAFT_1242530 [Cyathus striatus]|nr:hypothetical protein BDQ17DRAFT_1263215 [Cyathus striatus]KAF9002908.1 hypothetical protein BDQ17DRAFT_1242530 [Cyathus striatus]
MNAACLGAGHCSAECSNTPKCHPETRKAVINDIMSWEHILWLTRLAGAGKSSIIQTIAER